MAPPTNFERAESDRDSIRDQLDLLDAELTDNATIPLPRRQVEAYLEEAAEAKKQLMDNHRLLRSAASKNTDMQTYVEDFKKLLKQAARVHAGFHGILMAMPPPVHATTSSSPRRSSSTATSSQQSIKLPPLELPKFSGNLQEWVSFRDLFITAVHNSSLTKVEKLTQLKALLTGEAARQVRSLVLSEANYDIAWKSLQDRYENNRELLFSILKRLMNQPVISSGTASSIRSLIDTTKECVRSLDVLAIPTQHWDAILLFTLFSKLDNTSRELWEQSLQDSSIPALSKLYEFLEQRARALAASTTQPPPRQQARQQTTQVRAHHVTTSACKLGCSNNHPLFRCQMLQQQTPQQRLDTVKGIKLCINCLLPNHIASACPSKHNCKVCNRRHHTMLHIDGGPLPPQQQSSTQQSSQPQRNTSSTVQSHLTFANDQELKTGIIATARVRVISNYGESIHRTMIDGGSTNTHITERAARRLSLPLHSCNIPMAGLQDSSLGVAKYVTSFTFKPYFDSTEIFTATAIVVKSINSCIPSRKLAKEEWSHLQNLQLADPDYYLPGSVDILFGTDIFWGILEMQKISGNSGQPFGVKSSLGWLVAGPNISSTPVAVFNVNIDLSHQLQGFWEQENLSEEVKLTPEETACEQHFKSTYQRDSKGRFTVSLPFRSPRPQLGESKQTAIRRFLSLERKFITFSKNKEPEEVRKLSQQWEEYKNFMLEYEQLGHMERIPPEEVDSCSTTYYIPHHSVIKESSTTTRLRVVFDASASTSTGVSLNDCLMVGPQLQDTIWEIMLRFRIYLIVFTADLCKMYRQILVAQQDADFQRIVWRNKPSLPLSFYRLLTVTYGTGCASYLAIKCLQELATLMKDLYPKASKVLLRDFYVDDTASGCNNLEEAKDIVQQLIKLCSTGGFELRKWTTNSPELLATIPEQLRETNNLVEFSEDSTIKTLGVYWNPSSDKYMFKLSLAPEMPGKYTKRIILSEIAKIYDPLGWLAPTIISCKIFMQELWKIKYDWDDILPLNIQQHWINLRTSLSDIEKIKIPRCVISENPVRKYLIGYSDASIKAISSVIYIYCEYENQSTTCHLLTSKTRVAPVKHVTLPRLELNAALLLSELLHSTLKSLQIQFDGIRAFTDSTITLHWINSEPSRWKLYVRRRVQNIQDNVPAAQWFHIPGDKNPADCASRGISAEELYRHNLWWNGAPDLQQHSSNNVDLLESELQQLETESQVTSHHAEPRPLHPIFTKFASFQKLQRVVAYIFRFCNNWHRPLRHTPLQKGSLTVNEITTATNFIIRQLQQLCFPVEYTALANNLPLPSSNSLLRLKPFIDRHHVIRVGGRLRNADILFERKHPIILPRGHFVTATVIRDIHLQNFHSGPAATLAILQQRFWVTNGRDTIRAIIRKCVTCARQRAELMTQVMGDLPTHRINPSRPFSKVGIDYAGPIIIRPMVRSKVTLKCWLSIFVCLATRAIHIEVVSSLSTDCFLAAFRRFISRRGKPSDVFSDCGTNFKGADKVLRDFLKLTQQQRIQDEFCNQQISWHFNPPGAPHFGGLWEAGVKSLKHHLLRVMGSSHLTYEEMHTLVTQIEGILNSRPLVPASTDPSDLGVLTPAHFLIGSSLAAIPEPDLMDKKENYLQRWQLLQQRQQLFWKRWSSEYLTRLQNRPKWMKTSPELLPGQMVIIKDERLPPLKWKLGRVVAVHPGADGHVRVATIKTTDGDVKRPIVKLSLLPIPT